MCEFQTVLKMDGKTPNPNFVKHIVFGLSVYCEYHLTQHFPKELKSRLRMHVFRELRPSGPGAYPATLARISQFWVQMEVTWCLAQVLMRNISARAAGTRIA